MNALRPNSVNAELFYTKYFRRQGKERMIWRMDKKQENYLLAMFFQKGLSEKTVLVPKWYPYALFLIFAIMIVGIINLFTRKVVIGLLFFVGAFGIYYLCYIYRRQKVSKAIKNIKPKEVENLFPSEKGYFPACKKCGKETSRAGNITDMILSMIKDMDKFNQRYGMIWA